MVMRILFSQIRERPTELIIDVIHCNSLAICGYGTT